MLSKSFYSRFSNEAKMSAIIRQEITGAPNTRGFDVDMQNFGKTLLPVFVFTTMVSSNPAFAVGDDWYPASIALPPGYQYPCALTALPRNLPGIPEGDRKYINHVYSMILKCVQAKVIIFASLNNKNTIDSVYSRYYYDTKAAFDKIKQEPTPRGLESFRDQVLSAVSLQMSFFAKARSISKNGGNFNQMIGLPEGKQASSQLHAAWASMISRYPSLPGETKDSIYHHLCALDLF